MHFIYVFIFTLDGLFFKCYFTTKCISRPPHFVLFCCTPTGFKRNNGFLNSFRAALHLQKVLLQA